MSGKFEPATKKDLEEVVSGAVQEVLTAVGEQFGQANDDLTSIKADLNRIENKLDATIDKTDDHEVRIKRLESKVA